MDSSLGVIAYSSDSPRKTDYLYRISLKCLVQNEKGEVLVVKEGGRQWWDLPGGGMDHGEDTQIAIAREMKEEVNLEGTFTYRVIAVDEPAHLSKHNFWQLRLIFAVAPQSMAFSAGDDGDEVGFKNPVAFKDSESEVERRIYHYSRLV